MRTALDLVDKDRAAPAVLDRGSSIPDTLVAVGNLVEQDAVVEPRQLCSNLLHKFFLGPDFGEATHVLQVARREALQIGKLALEVCGQTIDDLSALGFFGLSIEDVAANLPIQEHQLAVRRECGAQLGRLNTALQLGEELRVSVGRGRFHSRSAFIVVHDRRRDLEQHGKRAGVAVFS